MPADPQRAPLPVYMLADHLDAVLAAGEDLVTRGMRWRELFETPGNIETFPQRQRQLAEEVRGLEMIVIARTLKSRDHARALAQVDKRFGAVANLFVSGTSILLDAIEECGDSTDADFETGDGLIAYVRGRGLIAPDAANVTHCAQLTIDESFLVAKRLALGPLMDMAAAFLDALETHYDLFFEDDDEEQDRTSAKRGSKASKAEAPREFGRRERAPVN